MEIFGSISLVGEALLAGKVHRKNCLEQLKLVGPSSLGVSLLTAGFVGMVFTIQVQKTLLAILVTRKCLKREQTLRSDE